MATIASVHKKEHAMKTSSWVTYDYDVTLSQPAGGAAQTVVHDPTKDFQQFQQGGVINVLVDPKQTDYAELPGLRVESKRWYGGPLILGVVFVGLAVLLTYQEIKHRRLKRAAGAG
jgi:hypothetical protein